MRTYAQHFLLVGLLMAFCISFSGCLKTEITTGKQPANETVELDWAHGLVYGIVPPTNSPLQVGDQCENGVSEVYFRQTFVQVIVQGLSSSLYSPQRFTVTCASGGSMSSFETPPSYLQRDVEGSGTSSSMIASSQ